jgi:hypothetical protein
MELVNTSFAARSKFVHAVRDPLCSIARNDLDAGKLFLGQLPVERFQDRFAMPLSSPYNRVGVVVDNDRDVLVSFLVAGFVNADVYKIIKALGTLRLNDI